MLFSSQDEKDIVKAIKYAESLSTGEIRVHLDKNLKGDPLSEAQAIFSKLGMENTKHRNAVLLYISENKKEIAIIGDKKIHDFVKQSFWNELIDEIIMSFKKEEYKEGIITAILKTGEKLKKFFPINEEDNINEVSDEISR